MQFSRVKFVEQDCIAKSNGDMFDLEFPLIQTVQGAQGADQELDD